MAYKDPAKKRAWHRRWRRKNHKRLAARMRAWRRKPANAVKHRAWSRRWYRRNTKRAAATMARWRARNRKRVQVLHRQDSLWRRYRLTEADVAGMKAAQRGRCALCRRKRRLVVDHCHRTKRVRALLCDGCNGALGTVERVGLAAIARYLYRHGLRAVQR